MVVGFLQPPQGIRWQPLASVPTVVAVPETWGYASCQQSLTVSLAMAHTILFTYP